MNMTAWNLEYAEAWIDVVDNVQFEYVPGIDKALRSFLHAPDAVRDTARSLAVHALAAHVPQHYADGLTCDRVTATAADLSRRLSPTLPFATSDRIEQVLRSSFDLGGSGTPGNLTEEAMAATRDTSPWTDLGRLLDLALLLAVVADVTNRSREDIETAHDRALHQWAEQRRTTAAPVQAAPVQAAPVQAAPAQAAPVQAAPALALAS